MKSRTLALHPGRLGSFERGSILFSISSIKYVQTCSVYHQKHELLIYFHTSNLTFWPISYLRGVRLGFLHFPFNFSSFIILNPITTILTFETINRSQQIVMVWEFATLQVVLLGGFTPKKAHLGEFPSSTCFSFAARQREKRCNSRSP